MDFSIQEGMIQERMHFGEFMERHLLPHMGKWYAEEEIPRSFFRRLGDDNRLGFDFSPGDSPEQSSLRQARQYEQLARVSPGVAVAVIAHVSLGMKGLFLYGSEDQKARLLESALRGETLICLGNTESGAGSDVANIRSTVNRVGDGWILNGTKAYVTNGSISDKIIVTAVSEPGEERNGRISMFLVDLAEGGITRTKLRKQVWIPSDLTRVQFKDVFVPDENLLGERGRGLQQVLDIFTQSRLSISALTIGTAQGAFELALDHARKRKIFGTRLVDFQAKSFEIAELYTRIEAARLMLWKACLLKDSSEDFRLESSMAKYLSVEIAREVASWAADLFGAASVMPEHPVHKFPMDAWASSLGKGTQDVQKLIVFREIMKKGSEIFG